MLLLQRQQDKNYLVWREKSPTSSVNSDLQKSNPLHCWVRRREETKQQLCGQFGLWKKPRKVIKKGEFYYFLTAERWKLFNFSPFKWKKKRKHTKKMSWSCFEGLGVKWVYYLEGQNDEINFRRVEETVWHSEQQHRAPRLSSGSLVLFLRPCQVFFPLPLTEWLLPPISASPQVFNSAVPSTVFSFFSAAGLTAQWKNPKEHRFTKCASFISVCLVYWLVIFNLYEVDKI